MKYYISNTKDYGLSISMRDGTEEDRRNICVLADNLFGSERNQIRVVENYDTHMFYLKDARQFQRLIKWKCLFDSWTPNKPFRFLTEARKAAKIAREVLNNQVFQNERGDDNVKNFAEKYCF